MWRREVDQEDMRLLAKCMICPKPLKFYIGLAKKFIWIFPLQFTKNPNGLLDQPNISLHRVPRLKTIYRLQIPQVLSPIKIHPLEF